MQTTRTLARVLAATSLGLAGCCGLNLCSSAPLKTPKQAFTLTGRYTNPDGMCIHDGEVYVNMNNIVSGKPSTIVKITRNNQLEEVVTLPVHPKTGAVTALGIVFAQDGNLYVNDNQNFGGKGLGLSRILRVVMANKKVQRVETVAVGINEANGITTFGDELYVADTNFGTKEPFTSGIYRFKLAELSAEKPVVVQAGPKDPHCIGTFTTTGKYSVGANGVAADQAGNVYVCNFGDAVLWRFTFNKDRTVKSFEPFAFCKDAGVESLDGLQYDHQGSLWTTDFIGNAVVRIDTATGKTTIVAKNAPNAGANGKLVSPSECIRLNNTIYVSNINLTYGPHTAIPEQTMSAIDVE